jgi:hypothetical protein
MGFAFFMENFQFSIKKAKPPLFRAKPEKQILVF